MSKKLLIPEKKIHNAILMLRGKRIVVDKDLASFYGVPTKVFNQAIKRNIERFPEEFMFKLNEKEKEYVVTNCDHLSKIKYSPNLPFAFTEHGVVMAANVLNSAVAVQASIQVVKVFIKISQLISNHKELAEKIEKLGRHLKSRVSKHDKEIKTLFLAIRQLMEPVNLPRKKIGFKRTESD